VTTLRMQPSVDSFESRKVDQLYQKLKVLSANCTADGFEWVGREARIALRHLKRSSNGLSPDARSRLIRIANRYSSEPSLWMMPTNVLVAPFEISQTIFAASRIAARPTAIASRPMSTTYHGKKIVFSWSAEAADWLAQINSTKTQTKLGPLWPFYLFSCTIVNHPFTDCNGRFARALFSRNLLRTVGSEKPILALGPSFALHFERLCVAFSRLNVPYGWMKFVDEIADIALEAVDDSILDFYCASHAASSDIT
jgi:hypothetical protein